MNIDDHEAQVDSTRVWRKQHDPDKEELEKQIERERLEIENAPKIPISQLSGMVGRCHWCGSLSNNLIPVHDLGPGGNIISERYKGADCCGPRNI